MRRVKRARRLITPCERAEIWRRWRAGTSYTELARLLKRCIQTVWGVINPPVRHGIEPPARKRSARHLQHSEREEISRELAKGRSLTSIAVSLQRPTSTVWREVTRNGGSKKYRAENAERRARSTAARPKACKLALQPKLRGLVTAKLRRRWSPQQVAAWLQLQYPDDVTMQVSHETIYRSLFIQTRGVLKAELLDFLRSQRRARRPRTTSKGGRGKIVDAISIRERPAQVEDRAVPGHWEGDLLVGTHKSCIATLVERSSRFVMLVKVDNKQTQTVVGALIKQARKLPKELRRSLTWDRGHEMAQHKRFSLATDIKVYFCDPHSPWQRGSNENTNGLLRQYFPKGEDMSHYSQAELNAIASEVNERPRKTLGFRSPAETLRELLR